MPQKRKYSRDEIPAVGEAITFLESLIPRLAVCNIDQRLGDECQKHADQLYGYLSRRMQRKGSLTETERKARNSTLILRKYQKRIAELEEKLLLVRTSTDLHERGFLTSGAPNAGGQAARMKRRIDHLEAKLLIIRDLSDTTVGKTLVKHKIDGPTRQFHDQRIRVDVEKALHNGRKPRINQERGRLLEQVAKGETDE